MRRADSAPGVRGAGNSEGAMERMTGQADRGTRQKDDRRGPGRAAICLLLTCLICLMAALPMVSGPGEYCRTMVRLPAPALEEALAETTDAARGAAWPEGLERRIRGLLTPVYGADHVVVQVSADDAGGTGRPAVSVAVIIDTSVMHGLPTSAEGLRVEQERLCALISHAAGLSGTKGDSVAVSFLLFSGDAGSVLNRWWMPAVAVLAVCTLLVLVLLRLRRSRQSDTPPPSDRKMTAARGGRHERLARRLRAESPQAGAVALGLLAAADAGRVLAAMPDDAACAVLDCMTSQSPVEREVLELVRDDCLEGFTADLDAFVSGGRACERAASLMSALDEGRLRRLTREMARSCPRAWERLEPLVD